MPGLATEAASQPVFSFGEKSAAIQF